MWELLFSLWQRKVVLAVVGTILCAGLGALLALSAAPASPSGPPQSGPITGSGATAVQSTPSPSVVLVGTIERGRAPSGTFVLQKPDGTRVTVHVTGSTRFRGEVRSLVALQPGMQAQVTGVGQPDGAVIALLVTVAGDN
jgi:hypothetical protein